LAPRPGLDLIRELAEEGMTYREVAHKICGL